LCALCPVAAAIFHWSFGLPVGRTGLIILRKAHFSPKLWTPPIRYGSGNPKVFEGRMIFNEKRLCDSSRTGESIPFQFAISRWNPPTPARQSGAQGKCPGDAGKGRKSRLFAYSISSPDSQLADHEVEIAESLRPCPRIFPFCSDYRRKRV
jgi:hypothetical protein